MMTLNNKQAVHDKRNELISEICQQKNIGENLLRFHSMTKISKNKIPLNTTRKEYILPKRNPFINSKLVHNPRSLFTYKMPLVRQIEWLKSKSTPLSSPLFLNKIKTVSIDFKRRTTDNFDSISKKIVEFNRVSRSK